MNPNERLESLSKPKQLHRDYLPSKEIRTVISPLAMKATCSERLDNLSEPKKRTELRQREWQIKKSSLKAIPSSRVAELSHPRGSPMGFLADKFESWKVSKAATTARPSSRIEKLSKPSKREVSINIPKEDAFIVSTAARNAKCSSRVDELAQPVKR